MLRPARKRSLHEDVARQLIRKMEEGEFRIGDKLPPERELARQLQVNRSTVREALRVLEYMRLVEKRHGNGVYVVGDPGGLSLEGLVFRSVIEDGLDRNSLRATFEAIVHVESAMAAMAALRRTQDDLADIAEQLEEMRAAVNSATAYEFAALDEGFHLNIGRVARSPVLLAVAKSIWEICMRYAELLYREATNRQRTVENHTLLVQAIEAQDKRSAARVMEKHFTWAWDLLFSSIVQGSDHDYRRSEQTARGSARHRG